MCHITDKYLNNVQKALHHLIPDEPYLSDLRSNLEEYVQQFPDCTYEDLVSQFGSPENVAQDFIDTIKPDSIPHRVKRKKRNMLFLIILLGIIIFLLLFVYTLSINRIVRSESETYIYAPVSVDESEDILN